MYALRNPVLQKRRLPLTRKDCCTIIQIVQGLFEENTPLSFSAKVLVIVARFRFFKCAHRRLILKPYPLGLSERFDLLTALIFAGLFDGLLICLC